MIKIKNKIILIFLLFLFLIISSKNTIAPDAEPLPQEETESFNISLSGPQWRNDSIKVTLPVVYYNFTGIKTFIILNTSYYYEYLTVNYNYDTVEDEACSSIKEGVFEIADNMPIIGLVIGAIVILTLLFGIGKGNMRFDSKFLLAGILLLIVIGVISVISISLTGGFCP